MKTHWKYELTSRAGWKEECQQKWLRSPVHILHLSQGVHAKKAPVSKWAHNHSVFLLLHQHPSSWKYGSHSNWDGEYIYSVTFTEV